MPGPRLILASASPQRQSLLREAGYEFIVNPADINEDNHPPRLLPHELARYLANAKAEAIARQFPDDIVLAADTVVAFGDQVVGKPSDAEHARKTLELLSGTTHVVTTGIAVIHKARSFARSTRVMTAVRVRPLTRQEIDQYVATNEWQGKAGGYGIQDPDPFVTRLYGSRSNVIGLPMSATRDILAAAGIQPSGRTTTQED